MRRIVIAILLLGLVASAASAQPFVRLVTDEGAILLVLDPELAPNHVANFAQLARSGFYDGTAFHRVIPGFMIQGGDPNSKDDDRSDDGQGGPNWDDVLDDAELAELERVRAMLATRGYAGLTGRAELREEFNSGTHDRGTLSMARAQSPDSAGSQFFITVADTPHLDGKYTVFGKVVSGMDVVDTIVAAPRDRRDNPLETIRIRSAKVLPDVDDLDEDERAAWEAFTTPDAAVAND